MSNKIDQAKLDADVVIVGGGMVGCSLALMMAQKKLAERILLCDAYSFDVSEQQKQASFDGRSTAISAGSALLFEQLDLWQEMMPHAQKIHEVRVSDRHKFGNSRYGAWQNNDRALGWVIENKHLGQCLKTAVENEQCISVLAPATVKNIIFKQGGVELDIAQSDKTDGRTDKKYVALAVLADGANSPQAKKLGIRFTQKDYKQHAVVTNVAHSIAHNGVAYEHFTEQGPLAFLPLPALDGQHRSAVVWTHKDSHIDEIKNLSDAAFIEQLQSVFAHRLGQITRVGARASYSLNLLLAEEQVRRRLVLVGNAAHFLHPVAGQGFNLAMRDCAVLVNALAPSLEDGRHFADFQALKSYAEARETDQWLTTELSHQFISMFGSSHPVKRFARTSGLTMMNKFPELKSLFFQQMMGLGLNGVSLK